MGNGNGQWQWATGNGNMIIFLRKKQPEKNQQHWNHLKNCEKIQPEYHSLIVLSPRKKNLQTVRSPLARCRLSALEAIPQDLQAPCDGVGSDSRKRSSPVSSLSAPVRTRADEHPVNRSRSFGLRPLVEICNERDKEIDDRLNRAFVRGPGHLLGQKKTSEFLDEKTKIVFRKAF